MDKPDWKTLSADLERLLGLRSLPFGMKLFERREDMKAIPKIRRPRAIHTMDQIVAQSAHLGWTVGVTAEDRQWAGYKRFDWSVVGESSCADSWGRARPPANRACRTRALPSDATAACSTTRC